MLRLPHGEDFLLAPVLAGLCKYESIEDGTLSIVDFAVMNDALYVRSYNENVMIERQKKEGS